VRAVRGAITVEENTKEEIYKATNELLAEIVKRNDIKNDEMISIIFSVTKDLDAAFPATAARQAGFNDVPLMCTNEIDVPNSLKKCIRILLHFNTDKQNSEIKHVYLKGAKILRPDIAD